MPGRNDDLSKTEAEWKERLTPEQFEVCRRKGTERPFSGKCWACKEAGIYVAGGRWRTTSHVISRGPR
ncbi:MAG: peptide-methionine (R)-S-oxide reductase [Nitrospirae bacterium]|nr:peptide-methionine (R)-S-oxide reductase [Nitrospirota bacterium]